MSAKHITPQNPLMRAFNFTETDLAANRAGYMSAHQASHLRSRQAFWMMIGLVMASVFFFPCGYLIVLQFQVGALIIPFLGILFLSAVAFGVYRFLEPVRRKLMPDIRDGRVLMIDGRVSLRKQDQGSRLICIVTIDSGQFEVRSDQLDAFEHGVRYRIYYSPRMFLILSAERVW